MAFPGLTFQEKQEEEARILWRFGLELAGLDRTRERAKRLFDEVIRRFRGSRNVKVRRSVALAYFHASELGRDNNFAPTRRGWREARRNAKRRLGYLDAMLKWLGAPSDPELRGWIPRALILKGAALQELQVRAEAVRVVGRVDRRDEAQRVFGQVLAFVTAEDDLPMRVNAARAAWMQGEMFIELKMPAKALVVLDRAVARFGAGAEPEMQVQVYHIVYTRGRTLSLLGRHEEAVDAFDEAIAKAHAVKKELRLTVLSAALGKAEALVAAKRYVEAIAVCNGTLVRAQRLGQDRLCVRAYELKATALKGRGKMAAARQAELAAKRS
jgi:tetratricopeptide (TPR) repeat protein